MISVLVIPILLPCRRNQLEGNLRLFPMPPQGVIPPGIALPVTSVRSNNNSTVPTPAS